jgi:hypothetical protein
MNSAGIGSFFNLTKFGQMYSYHALLLPVAVGRSWWPMCCSCARTAWCRRSSSAT